MNAVDRIANILSCGDNYRKRQQDHRRYAPRKSGENVTSFILSQDLLPVKSEHRAVYVNVRDFDEGLQPQKYV